MGLAASQARFLGITLRKANLEFRSTELAQQKLELTNQMSLISEEYFGAINATKLSWQNDLVCDESGKPYSLGVTYGLLMTPSEANNYNPYMVTTKSGAIVLNSKYQSAAQAAGISMAGGIPSESGYRDFIKELGVQGLITNTTEQILLNQPWYSTSGLGAIPKDKTKMDTQTLSDLVKNPDFGGMTLDWLQIYRSALGYEYDEKSTNAAYTEAISIYDDYITQEKLRYSRADRPGTGSNYGTAYVNNEVSIAESQYTISAGDARLSCSGIMAEFQALEDKIADEPNTAKKLQFTHELENLKNGYDANGDPINNDKENLLRYPLYWEIYEKAKFMASTNSFGDVLEWASNNEATPTNGGNTIGFNQLFHTYNRNIAGGNSGGNTDYKVYIPEDNQSRTGTSERNMCTISMFINDVMENREKTIKSLTLGDLLTKEIVLMTQVRDGYSNGAKREDAAKTLEIAGIGMLDYIARIFGYKNIGEGLNVDESTDYALQQAYAMTKRKFLSSKGAVTNGTRDDDANPLDNSAYINAVNHNRIGAISDSDDTYAALDISNMVSAFLTYFDNALRGADSDYIVGKANDASADGSTKSYFVTDDPNYVYITNIEDAMSGDEKINDFYSQLYNNICEHGWRYDGNLDDYEYLESTIKDGRYSLMALNTDGYFYQSRYNNIDYIVEEQDRDAIARAEADYTRKKAEITNKEDRIDIKTKKLDAEIAELTTELNSVQNLITKSIEKTFALFSN